MPQIFGVFGKRLITTRTCWSPLTATPRTVTRQAPLSMGFSRQEYGVGCHSLLQGIFLTQRSNPHLLWLLHWQASIVHMMPKGRRNGLCNAGATPPPPQTPGLCKDCFLCFCFSFYSCKRSHHCPLPHCSVIYLF